MGMANTTLHRIVARHIHATVFRKLEGVPVVLADGGVVTAADVQRLLALQEIYVLDVEFHSNRVLPNIFLWAGVEADGRRRYGQLRLTLDSDVNHVQVSGEITVLDVDRRTFEAALEPSAESDTIPMKQRFRMISSIARRAIADLRERPHEVAVVVAHLTDIVDLAERDGG